MKIKNKLTIVLTASLMCLSPALHAAEKISAGPKGGRLLETKSQQTEFFVNADRKVEITFYDASSQEAPRGGRTVRIIAEAPGGRQTLAMNNTATGFVSDEPLPAGEPYRVVVQLSETADSRPRNFRVAFNLEPCGECEYAEYACTCGH